MNLALQYAFYGSLRKGLTLYEQYKSCLDYRFSVWLPGFKLYSLGSYPCAVKSDELSDRILIEVMNVADPKIRKEIFELEIEAGYSYHEVIVQDIPTGIFLYQNAANYPLVHGGDWVKFYCK
ncbi:MAG: gamma-glutamylcyclotransferase [Cyclobacteriaceae bacterium]|nr:gamma-glutamylcyclotransferase [Cyclobacteriaceae bacterium]